MKEGSVDKRILKTKLAIHNAFQKLIQEKEMSDISICELTNEAHVTRSTFYMYYNTISDVRDDIENSILSNIDKVMRDTDAASVFINPYPFLSVLVKQIVAFDEKNKYILNENNYGRLSEKISQMIVDRFLKVIERSGQDTARAKYIIVFFASGILESFKMWYNHQSTLSLEELCRRMSNLIRKGIVIATAPGADD